jgi:signal transduction histidine kinase
VTAPDISLGSDRPFDWFRLSWGQLNWLLRLAELPATLILVALGHPRSHLGALVGLLAVASAAWVAWLWVHPSRSDAPAGGRPTLVLMLVIAVTSGLAAMITGAGNAALLALIVAVHAGAGLQAGRAVAVPLTGVAGVAVGSVVVDRSLTGQHVAFYAAVLAGAALAGATRGLRREQLRQARLRLAQEKQTRAEQQHAATLAERARIAREIHDILAHSLADLSIQLEVADALLADNADTTGALQRVRYAHRLAGEGMDETRRAVHALRSDAPPLPEALAAMVGTQANARFETDGPLRALHAAAGLALVRTAQEALVNVRKHAAGHAVLVHLRYGADRVCLTVTDREASAPALQEASPPTPCGDGMGGGYGLAGMHERLRLVGGSLLAGPAPDGWVVRAEVPG